MKINSTYLKLTIGAIYLAILFAVLYFLFSKIDMRDLTNYEFIRANKDLILHYKNSNFFLLTISFFIFSIIWYLLLGFAGPILLFAGFVYGKWYGVLIAVFAATIGTTFLYILAKLFFSDFIKEKLEPKFSKLKLAFEKNEFFYFTLYRFAGGGGIPYGIQNVLPVLFNISTKNYFLGTLIGSWPTMFITVALGAGIEKYIDKNENLNFLKIISSPDIYLPVLGFVLMMFIGLIIKKFFFKTDND
tara:strand:- start:6355 stop:7089 length:735 start_codon:yes stop_codon:yes gene_type:complete